MVPEDEHVAVGREVLAAPLDEARKVVRVGHGGGTGVLDQRLKTALRDAEDLVDLIGDRLVLPLLAAAGEDEDVHLVRELGGGHLHQILGGHAVLRLEVGAAHVDHESDGVLSVADDVGELGAGAGGDGGVEIGNVAVGAPGVGDGRGEHALDRGERGAAALRRLLRGRGGGAAAAEEVAKAARAEQDGEDERDQAAADAAGALDVPAGGLLRRTGAGADRTGAEAFVIPAMDTETILGDVRLAASRSVIFRHEGSLLS